MYEHIIGGIEAVTADFEASSFVCAQFGVQFNIAKCKLTVLQPLTDHIVPPYLQAVKNVPLDDASFLRSAALENLMQWHVERLQLLKADFRHSLHTIASASIAWLAWSSPLFTKKV
jgi:hypothetical protein